MTETKTIKDIEAGEKKYRKRGLCFDTIMKAKTMDIMNMDIEKFLGYILFITREEKFADMNKFRTYISDMLALIHQNNMLAVNNYFGDMIKVY